MLITRPSPPAKPPPGRARRRSLLGGRILAGCGPASLPGPRSLAAATRMLGSKPSAHKTSLGPPTWQDQPRGRYATSPASVAVAVPSRPNAG